MKIVGLITEYNPFHNGHLYHIQQAKRTTGADAVIVVMSGDYVQRGVPAVMPKRLRAESALECGASAVFELPVCYSTGSAELFAESAVALLDQLQIVDSLCFGSECGDLDALSEIADLLCQEPKDYRSLLKKHFIFSYTMLTPVIDQQSYITFIASPVVVSSLSKCSK